MMVSHRAVDQLQSWDSSTIDWWVSTVKLINCYMGYHNGLSVLICRALSQPPSYKETFSFRSHGKLSCTHMTVVTSLQAHVPICGWLMVIPCCVTLSWCWGRLLRWSNHFINWDLGLLRSTWPNKLSCSHIPCCRYSHDNTCMYLHDNFYWKFFTELAIFQFLSIIWPWLLGYQYQNVSIHILCWLRKTDCLNLGLVRFIWI